MLYIGDSSGKAKNTNAIYVGDSTGKSRRVVTIYQGDANGKAKVVYSGIQDFSLIGEKFTPTWPMSVISDKESGIIKVWSENESMADVVKTTKTYDISKYSKIKIKGYCKAKNFEVGISFWTPPGYGYTLFTATAIGDNIQTYNIDTTISLSEVSSLIPRETCTFNIGGRERVSTPCYCEFVLTEFTFIK